jgi:uncharacterized protein YcbK (DUF882 family)
MEKMSKFEEIKTQFETKINDLRREIRETEQKVEEFAQDYREAMTAHALGGGKEAANALAYARGAWTHEKQKLEDAQERLAVLEQVKAQKLAEAMPNLVKENRAQIDAIRQEYVKAAQELLKQRAEILLTLRSLWRKGQEARSIYDESAAAARIAGVEFRDRFEMPMLNLFGTHGTKDSWLLPLNQEASVALHTGQVPAFVEWYAISGELIGENEAAAKLAQARKEGRL